MHRNLTAEFNERRTGAAAKGACNVGLYESLLKGGGCAAVGGAGQKQTSKLRPRAKNARLWNAMEQFKN